MGSEWTYCQLGDVATIQGGFAFKSRDFLESGVPVAKIRNVRNRDIDLSEADCVSEDIAKEHSDFYVREGDVLISMTGSGINAPASIVGRVARHTGSNGDFLINQRVGRFVVCDNEKADLRYLYYFFSSSQIRNLLVSIATGSANQVNISAKQIESVELPLPPLREQEAIAHILGTLDDKIELNRRMNRTLEAIARAVFKSWFVDFDPVRAKAEGREPVGMDPEIAALFPDSFQDSPLGKIPRGWETTRIGEVVENVREKVAPTPGKDTEKYIALDDMRSGSVCLDSWRRGSEVNSSIIRFRRDDILFGSMRPYFHKVGIAPFNGITRTTTFVLRPVAPDLRLFALFHLSSTPVIEYSTNASVGSTIPYVKWDALAAYEIPIPPMELPHALEGFLAAIVWMMNSASDESRRLAVTRDAILPRLLSGVFQPAECVTGGDLSA
jgi:type I restriction enzyme S subunit